MKALRLGCVAFLTAGFVYQICAQPSVVPEVRTGFYHGFPVTYQVIEGLAIYEGDIILGSAAELAASAPQDPPKPSGRVDAAFTSIAARLWPNGIVPYTIDSDIPNQARIMNAIQYYNQNTPLKFQPRNGEANYLRYMRTTIGDGVCYSALGMIGGEQLIRTDDLCGTPGMIHEMGHTIGFFHEQDRKDRNQYITVLYEHIDKTQFGEFPIGGANEQDLGSYEYASIMHYQPLAFSRDADPVMQTVPAGIPFREVTVLSPGDLDTINRLYGRVPGSITVTSNPPGLQLVIDGAPVTTPQVFSWVTGSAHTLNVPVPQTTATARYLFGRWSDGGDASHVITASPAVTLYTANFVRQVRVSIAVSPADTGTVTSDTSSPDGYYTSLTEIHLQATPRADYYFMRWQAPAGGTCPAAPSSNPATILTRAINLSCIAVFSAAPVTTVTSDPPGRTVTVDGTRYTTPLSFAWAAGSSHMISAMSPPSTSTSTVRYIFRDWSDGEAGTHSITVTSPGSTFTARFTTQYPLALTAPPANQGTITVNPASSDGFYDAGTQVQITAAPAAGLVLQSWQRDLRGTANPQYLVMNEQQAVAAIFIRPANLPPLVVLNAASFQGGAVSPGEIITVFGSGIGPGTLTGLQLDASGRVATRLSDTRALFDGVPAPVVYASASQTAVIVPYAVAGKQTTQLVMEYKGQRIAAVNLSVAQMAPSLFTADSSGKGIAAVLNQDGSVNSVPNPAVKGSVVVFYATGEGQTLPGGVDGSVTGAPPPTPLLPVSVRIGGKPADILYAGEASGLVAGVMQVNARIPSEAASGNSVSVYLVTGNASSPSGVTMAIQ